MFQKCFKLFCFIIGISAHSLAQETPYYQPPQKRLNNHELINIPNLSSKSISYYIGLTGGFKKSFKGDYLTSPFDIISNSYTTGLYEINLGQNLDDNIMFETGVSHLKGSLTTTFMNISRQPVIFTNEKEQFYIPLRIKKRVLTIDRITKSAFINLGVGAAYNVSKPSVNEKQIINFLLPKVPSPNDISRLTIEKTSSSFPMLFEAFAEIRGKISERLEISVFIKSIFKNQKDLSNNFILEKVSGESQYFGNFEKSVSLTFGLQARFNSPKFLKYSSNVE